jgi:hypothetical protein
VLIAVAIAAAIQFSRIAKTLQKKGRDVLPIHPLFLWNTTESTGTQRNQLNFGLSIIFMA